MRKYYIDNIRWITVVIVVIYHVIYIFNGVITDGVIGPFHEVQYQDAFQYFVYPWFMVLLFVISGMSARYYLERHTDKEFIKSRTAKLLVPSTLGLFAFQWILGYYNMAISNAIGPMTGSMPDTMPAVVKSLSIYIIMVMSGTGVLWFVQVLWILSVLLVLVRKIEKDRLYQLLDKVAGLPSVILLLGLGILVLGAAQILNTPIIVVYRFGIYGISFLIGYCVLSHDKITEELSKDAVPFVVVALVLGVGYSYYYFGENYAVPPLRDNVFSVSYGWIATLAVIAAMKKWGNRTNAFCSRMAEKSWGLYVFHYLPLAVTAYYLNLYAQNVPAVVCYILVAIMAFGGAFVLYEVISRIPVLRFLVLGIRKRKEVEHVSR